MLIRRSRPISESEVTDESYYRARRQFIKTGIAATALPFLGSATVQAAIGSGRFADAPSGPFSTDEELTPYEDVTTYNNFYEFDTGKKKPAILARNFKARPWTVTVDGEVEAGGEFDVDALIKRFPPEERIYRLRCVEAWSMVIPWIGFPLEKLVKAVRPTSKARFVRFETLYDPERMPGQKAGLFGPVLDWPYVEGLRIDEAVHPLALLSVGLYGEVLPNQNGAPIRLVVPWKYGFKSIKSIVRITFTDQQPVNTWQSQASNEYGFFANVNPEVDHPRWSQAEERRIGDFFKRPTEMFNGYAEEVADLYRGMDLERNF